MPSQLLLSVAPANKHRTMPFADLWYESRTSFAGLQFPFHACTNSAEPLAVQFSFDILASKSLNVVKFCSP